MGTSNGGEEKETQVCIGYQKKSNTNSDLSLLGKRGGDPVTEMPFACMVKS